MIQHKSGNELETAPKGAKVTFTLYADDKETSPAQTVTLDGTVDENGEATAWKATFSGLQKYKVENGGVKLITYTVDETGTWEGFVKKNGPVSDGGTIINRQGTFWVQFVKADETDTMRLSGASFTFNPGSGESTITSNDNTGVLKSGAVDRFELAMRENPYEMTETVAPSGYNKLTENVFVKVTTSGVSSQLGESGTPKKASGKGTSDEPYVVVINNTAGAELPNTGGPGTWIVTLVGGMLVALAAGIALVGRRRNGQQA